jgi:hypothetical protein
MNSVLRHNWCWRAMLCRGRRTGTDATERVPRGNSQINHGERLAPQLAPFVGVDVVEERLDVGAVG